jgi:hypothetical protein
MAGNYAGKGQPTRKKKKNVTDGHWTSFLSKLRRKRPAHRKRAKNKNKIKTDIRPRFCRNYAGKGQPARKGRVKKKKNVTDGQTDQHDSGSGFEAASTTAV